MSKPCLGVGKMTCSACKSITYCSSNCQTADWPTHKLVCFRRGDNNTIQVHNKSIYVGGNAGASGWRNTSVTALQHRLNAPILHTGCSAGEPSLRFVQSEIETKLIPVVSDHNELKQVARSLAIALSKDTKDVTDLPSVSVSRIRGLLSLPCETAVRIGDQLWWPGNGHHVGEYVTHATNVVDDLASHLRDHCVPTGDRYVTVPVSSPVARVAHYAPWCCNIKSGGTHVMMPQRLANAAVSALIGMPVGKRGLDDASDGGPKRHASDALAALPIDVLVASLRDIGQTMIADMLSHIPSELDADRITMWIRETVSGWFASQTENEQAAFAFAMFRIAPNRGLALATNFPSLWRGIINGTPLAMKLADELPSEQMLAVVGELATPELLDLQDASTGDTLLHLFVETGNVVGVRNVFAAGGNVLRNNEGRIALYSFFSDPSDQKAFAAIIREFNRARQLRPDLFNPNDRVLDKTFLGYLMSMPWPDLVQAWLDALDSDLKTDGFYTAKDHEKYRTSRKFRAIIDAYDPKALFNAALENDIPRVGLLIDNGAQPDAYKSSFGHTALGAAVQYGFIDTVNILVKRGADVNKVDVFGWTPIYNAVRQDQREIVRFLLEPRLNVDVNKADKIGITPINFAVLNDNIEIVRLLLEREDIDIYAPDHNGMAPIDNAVKFNRPEIERLLRGTRLNAGINRADNDGQTPIHIAAKNGSVVSASFLLEREGIDVNRADKNGNTPINIAVKSGRLEIARLLIAREDIDVNKADKNGNTPIDIAVKSGQVEAVSALLKHPKSDVNAPDQNGQTPIYFAVKYDRPEIVRLLLARPEIDVNKADKNGNTPIRDAVNYGRLEIVRLLLARPEIDVNKAGKNGNTPIYIAADMGVLEIVRLLLARPEIDVNKANTDGETPIYIAVDFNRLEIVRLLLARPEIDVNTPDKTGQTPIYFAVKYDRPEIVSALLEHPKIDVNAPDKDGNTAMLTAVINGNITIVGLLLARPEIDANKAANTGETPLMAAAILGKPTVVKLLLQPRLNVDVNKADRSGNTAIHIAVGYGRLEIVRLLIAHENIDINQAGNDGQTPIHIAVKNGSVESVSLLLDHDNIDVNKADKNGNTPIYMAVDHDKLEIVRLLLARPEIDVNTPDQNGRTPIYIAARNDWVEGVSALLKHPKIDVNVPDKNGQTAIKDVVLGGKIRIVPLLLARPEIDVNKADNEGMTPLMAAVIVGKLEIVKLLLESRLNVDVNKADQDGNTAINMAVKLNNLGIVYLLLEHKDINVNVTDREGRAPIYYAVKNNRLETVRALLTNSEIDVPSVLLDDMDPEIALLLLFGETTPLYDDALAMDE